MVSFTELQRVVSWKEDTNNMFVKSKIKDATLRSTWIVFVDSPKMLKNYFGCYQSVWCRRLYILWGFMVYSMIRCLLTLSWRNYLVPGFSTVGVVIWGHTPWWRHDLLAIGHQWVPVMIRNHFFFSFYVFFVRLNKRLNKHWSCAWFGTPWLLMWRHWRRDYSVDIGPASDGLLCCE